MGKNKKPRQCQNKIANTKLLVVKEFTGANKAFYFVISRHTEKSLREGVKRVLLLNKQKHNNQTISQPARIRPDQLKRVQNRTRSGKMVKTQTQSVT